eukprot:975196-Pleurochrysis_carterae.AAC.3
MPATVLLPPAPPMPSLPTLPPLRLPHAEADLVCDAITCALLGTLVVGAKKASSSWTRVGSNVCNSFPSGAREIAASSAGAAVPWLLLRPPWVRPVAASVSEIQSNTGGGGAEALASRADSAFLSSNRSTAPVQVVLAVGFGD